jgi:Hemerythrin HHE cation binding domain
MSVPLPLLPPFGPDSPTGRNVVDVLAEEHRAIVKLCADLLVEGVPEERRRRLAQVVVATVSRHLSAEEQYLYPAVRASVPTGDLLADRELAEDHAILVTLRELAGAGGADLDRAARTLATQLCRHAEAAGEDVLPLLLQLASTDELVRLGNRVETAEEAAPTRPHPATPSTPPWNKVVDPAVGVLDRVRDAVGRRVTYADRL